jgi:hypothetical protein
VLARDCAYGDGVSNIWPFVRPSVETMADLVEALANRAGSEPEATA